jgi:hypothetical protein
MDSNDTRQLGTRQQEDVITTDLHIPHAGQAVFELDITETIGSVNAVVENADIVARVVDQMSINMFAMHGINEGAFLQSTDNIFYWLDTAGSVIDIYSLSVGTVIKQGSKASAKAWVRNVGRVIGNVDPWTNAKRLGVKLGKMSAFATGHGMNNIGFLKNAFWGGRLAENLINTGKVTKSSFAVRFTDEGFVTYPAFREGMLDHLGMWRQGDGTSKIKGSLFDGKLSATDEGLSGEFMYKTLLEETQKLRKTDLEDGVVRGRGNLAANEHQMVDDFFEIIMENHGEKILKKHVDTGVAPPREAMVLLEGQTPPSMMHAAVTMGSVDDVFSGASYWGHVLDNDAYRVWTKQTRQGKVVEKTMPNGTVVKTRHNPTSIEAAPMVDGAVTFKYKGHDIPLPIEILPPKYKTVIQKWLKNPPRDPITGKVKRGYPPKMKQFMDEHVGTWAFMHKLNLIKKYTDLDYRDLMKIMAATDSSMAQMKLMGGA